MLMAYLELKESYHKEWGVVEGTGHKKGHFELKVNPADKSAKPCYRK